MDERLRVLLEAAVQAPSGDNTQPWRFVVDAGTGRIALYVDEARDPSPMNAGQRMSRIAVGAALENLLLTAKNSGCFAELEEASRPAMAVVRIQLMGWRDAKVPATVMARVSNRRRYNGRPLPESVIAELQRNAPQYGGIRIHWIHDRARLIELATLVGRADALMLGEPSMRGAFLDNVRFDLPYTEEAEQGLPLGSLELSRLERIALRTMGRLPDWLLKAAGARGRFAVTARKLVESASGLCIVTQEEITPQMDVLAGRALQRAWLAMTDQGLSVQPMMSLAILENVLRYGAEQIQNSLGRDKAAAMVEEFRSAAPEITGRRVAFIMRFGFAPPPTVRTGRLPLGESVTEHAVSECRTS